MRPSFLTNIENSVFRGLLMLPDLWEYVGAYSNRLGKPEDSPIALASQARRLARLSQIFPRFERSPLTYARRQLHLSSRMMMRPAAPGVQASYRKLKTKSRLVDYLFLEPKGCKAHSPIILYFHGGGWTLGQHDTFDRELSWLAHHSKMRLASFDYLLAPEHPYPIPLHDVQEIYDAVVASMSCPLIVAGDSAGAHLASLISISQSQKQDCMPAAQLLFYPVTDLRMNSASHQKFADGYLLTKDLMRWFRSNFLTDLDQVSDVSPLLHQKLEAQPPTLLVTAAYDVLHDEGYEFSKLLEKSGTFVKYHECSDLLHGFIAMTGVIPEAAKACDQIYLELQSLQL
ncbi:MAG: alpha/beta hydrolase [Oligoflexus sp.]